MLGACLGKLNTAVPYIPALRLFFILLSTSISTGKFKVASAFAAINVILPLNFSVGKTDDLISILSPILRFATCDSLTFTLSFNLETSTISNNWVPCEFKNAPTSMYLLLMIPLIGDLMFASLNFLCEACKRSLAFWVASLAWSSCCWVTPPVAYELLYLASSLKAF
ncbi:hypothetical protein D3C86_1624500 [compost metagenome]